jgi:ribosomal protein S18 acetylase RimI-like enzyme
MTRPSGSLIEWVGVLPEERGRNLGEALMVACLNYLKGRAVQPNCLVTQYFRQAAVGLYAKLGYRVVRECRSYIKELPTDGSG